MKNNILRRMMILTLLMGITGLSRAENDTRIIGKIGQNSPKDQLRTASFYLVFNGTKSESLPALPSGDDTRFYSKVWDGLYLQAITESGEKGTSGYMFGFSKDDEDKNPVVTNESRDVPTLREVAAGDFRTEDNFAVRPLKPGPGTPEDRGAYRVIHYDGFDVEIRVLEFNVGDAELKKKPYFKSLACLVMVRETEPAKQAK